MHIGHYFLNFLLPPRCPNCGAWTLITRTLCSTCWSKVTFIIPPYCSQCGWPLPYPESLCLACLHHPPQFTQGRSIFYYEGTIRSLILKLKHHDATYVGPALAQFLHTYGGDIFHNVDALIPIPLHRWRFLRRGFNQTALIAFHLCKLRPLPIKINVLKRHKWAPSQSTQPGARRHDNIKGAFRLTPYGKKWIQNKNLLLFDDVWTTGATLEECSKILLNSGAKDIKALTIARVVPSS